MTRQPRRRRLDKTERAVADALRQYWHPIWLGVIPDNVATEFDEYALEIASLIERGATDANIAFHLRTIEADAMGFDTRRDFTEIAVRVREAMLAIDDNSGRPP